jgi:hypothetical protein
MTPGSMCAKHPAVAAVGTCSRCGTFGCNQCLSSTADGNQPTFLQQQGWLCADCLARGLTDLPSLEGRAQLAKGGLIFMAIAHIVLAGLGAVPGEAAQLALGGAGLLFLIGFVVTIVFFCRWFHLSVRYASGRGGSVGYTPAAAVGSWFIPFLNLVRPFDVTRRMLAAAGVDAGSVGTWQALWIIGNITSNISARTESVPLDIISALLMVGAAVTGAGVVSNVTRALQPVPTRIITAG